NEGNDGGRRTVGHRLRGHRLLGDTRTASQRRPQPQLPDRRPPRVILPSRSIDRLVSGGAGALAGRLSGCATAFSTAVSPVCPRAPQTLETSMADTKSPELETITKAPAAAPPPPDSG